MCSHLDDRSDGGLKIITFRLRGVEDLDRVGPSRNVHEGSVVKVVLELSGIQCGAHDHQLQVGPGNQ